MTLLYGQDSIFLLKPNNRAVLRAVSANHELVNRLRLTKGGNYYDPEFK
jgi:hypothetical protein